MTIIDRDAIIEKALIASGSEMTVGGIVRVAIKTAADDLLAPIEALHPEVLGTFTPHNSAAYVVHLCQTCKVAYPCPTAQAVAAIREAVRA